MAFWIAIPLLGSLMILQTVFVSRINLLLGAADLVMLVIIAWALRDQVKTAWQWAIIGGLFFGIASALPFGVMLVGYLIVVLIALLLRQRVWQVPFLAMMITTFLGTLITHTLSMVALQLTGTGLPVSEIIFTITLPSLLLNMLLAFPIYFLIGDLVKWIYPPELEA